MKNRILLLAAGAAFVWAGCGEQSSPLNVAGEDVVPAASAPGGATTQAVDPAGFVCETIDFNVAGDGTGTNIGSITAAGVTFDVTVSQATGHQFPPSVAGPAMLYDTDPPIGADPDLESTGICTACAGLEEILVVRDAGGPAAEGDSDGGGIITLDNFSPAGTFQIIEFLAVDDDDGPFALVVDGTETARSSSLGDGSVETMSPTTPNFNTSADFWLGIATAPGVTPRTGKRASGGFDNIRFCAQCQGVIGDFVWNDLDMDGIQDPGEPGLAGWTVNLYDAAMTLVATDVTDGMGEYLFPNLCPGTYTVEVIPQPGWTASPILQGPSDVDSNPNPDTTTLTTVADSDLTLDFGFFMPPPGGGEGCTPGYWKQPHHFDSWTLPYTPGTPFCDVFNDGGTECAFPGMSLVDVLSQGGGGLRALGRHTVAALLNAASPGVSYDLTVADVINMFNAVYPGSRAAYNALKDEFEGYNEQGCPLN